jgi:hypothetical protein
MIVGGCEVTNGILVGWGVTKDSVGALVGSAGILVGAGSTGCEPHAVAKAERTQAEVTVKTNRRNPLALFICVSFVGQRIFGSFSIVLYLLDMNRRVLLQWLKDQWTNGTLARSIMVEITPIVHLDTINTGGAQWMFHMATAL